ncbi:MAG: hypothetical protein ACR2RL_23000 [Gammaproteobacteria bacterium]
MLDILPGMSPKIAETTPQFELSDGIDLERDLSEAYQRKQFVNEHLSRRDLLRVAGRYGLTSTLLGGAAVVGPLTLTRLAEAANSTYEKRFKSPARHTLKFGSHLHESCGHLSIGCLFFLP